MGWVRCLCAGVLLGTMPAACGTATSSTASTASTNGTANVSCGLTTPLERLVGGPSTCSPGETAPLLAVKDGPVATQVSMGDTLALTPSRVSVRVHDIVEWRVTGSVGHDVVFDAGLVSPPLAFDDTYLVQFNQPGTYRYQCSIHPGEVGEVDVAAG